MTPRGGRTRTRWRVDIGSLLDGAAFAVWSPLPVAGQEHRDATTASCIGIGDVVQVSIFETSVGGARSGNYVTLPSQTVDVRGTFSVPFAGDIEAVGRALPEIAREIEAKLANRAIAPGVEVALVAQKATSPCR
jgi:protein involved in polysaccharide export with SLBB domain